MTQAPPHRPASLLAGAGYPLAGARLLLAGVSFLLAGASLSFATTAGAAVPGLILFHDDFETGIGDRWVEGGFPSIPRKNIFSVAVEPDGNHYLRVDSADSYSGKGVYLKFSSRRCPDVTWRWRVADVVATGDITRKDGDDGAAKLYVIFAGPSWWNPLDKRMLIYLWDNAAPVGAVVPNAWLPDKARMLVLESGRATVGQWVPERVNLADDFARAFPDEAPGDVEGVAFLADTDNTHGRVSAGFDDLVIGCTEPEKEMSGR